MARIMAANGIAARSVEGFFCADADGAPVAILA